MRSVVVWSVAAIGATAVGFAGLHVADHVRQAKPPPVAHHATEEANAALPGHAGMRVFIDPETGELSTPSAHQQKVMDVELQDMLSRSSDGLHKEVLPDGTVKVNLQGRFQSASIAVIDDDGNLHTNCVENLEGAQATLQQAQCEHTTLEEK